jgi:hypothetical protein
MQSIVFYIHHAIFCSGTPASTVISNKICAFSGYLVYYITEVYHNGSIQTVIVYCQNYARN